MAADSALPPLSPTACATPLFLGSPAALAAKLDGASGLLAGYWRAFCERCARDADFRADNLFLPAALGDDAKLLAEAADRLRDYYRMLARSDTAGDLQFHTWCRGGTTTRRVAFCDWLAARGALTPADLVEAAEGFVGFAYKHSYMVLTVRGRSSNNQALSMALNCAVTGFIFGYKLAQHPTARFLFDYGMGRLPDLIGLFPEDGYGGEGSTYTSHVNTPLAFWTHEFLRQVAGQDLLDQPFRPNGTTLRRLLEMELRLLSPGGLLAPWDHYGWEHAVHASPYAYLARVTGNPRYLAMIPAGGMGAHAGSLAWGKDDPLWTLVWWPDAAKDYAETALPAELFGWFLPKTGAALDDPARRVRLMQVWDHSSTTIAAVGRAQINPNHLMLDVAGEPVFQDGVPPTGEDPWQFPPDRVFACLEEAARDRYLRYLGGIGGGAGTKAELAPVVRGLAPGLLGVANAVVVDDEGWYWPGSDRVGRGEFYGRAPGLQAVTADCAAFYQPQYDVARVRRSSVWSDAGFGLVVDTLDAGSEHTWTWQAYLRAETTIAGTTATVPLTNAPAVRLAWTTDAQASLTAFPTFPRAGEGLPGGSQRLELRQRGRQVRFAVAIAPGATSVSVQWLGPQRVEVIVDGQHHLLVVDNFGGDVQPLGTQQSTAAFACLRLPHGKLAELTNGLCPPPSPDIHDLPDIDTDRALQLPLFEQLTQWTATRHHADAGRLGQVDAIFAELGVPDPDPVLVLGALQSPHWPVQAAAAEVVSRRGWREASAVLREVLAAEHARPTAELYPADDAPADGRDSEERGKRWRLKVALIVALGRLRDRQAVPLLGQILADNRDFYGVYSVAAQALGRIGGQRALAALAPAFLESEVNTRTRAEFARAAIRRHNRKRR